MHFLITAGGTREYIDPVRFISNAGTGKMGCCLARAVIRKGHTVTLISTSSALRRPQGAKVVYVETADQMFKAVKKYFQKCDCLIMAAAVADYTPAGVTRTKIKKTAETLLIKLKPTKDILEWAGRNKKDRTVVGFALEDKNLRRNAENKLLNKNLDMIIANRPSAIGSDKTTVHIKTPSRNWLRIGPASKASVACRIIRLLSCVQQTR
ncbi:MAG: phosphopantothenoylcysteine decarboxylase [Planctomycetota bacterium]